jgi:hypothetical protein
VAGRVSPLPSVEAKERAERGVGYLGQLRALIGLRLLGLRY